VLPPPGWEQERAVATGPDSGSDEALKDEQGRIGRHAWASDADDVETTTMMPKVVQ